MSTRPLRRTAKVVAVVLALSVLAGCAEDGEEYCEVLAEEQKTLTSLADDSAEGGDVLGPTLQSFERLQAAAPDELRDEWNTLAAAYESLVDAVQAAGIEPEEYDPEKPPEGISAQDRSRLAAVASKLSSTRVAQAALGIQDHAREVCEVDFTG